MLGQKYPLILCCPITKSIAFLTLNLYFQSPAVSKQLSLATMYSKYSSYFIPSIVSVKGFNSTFVVSSEVSIIMNSKMISFFNFNFKNEHLCNAYFWAGKGSIPNKNGIKIPDENGR